MNLEYRIGTLQLYMPGLLFDQDTGQGFPHKFVVESINNSVLIYVAPEDFHRDVVELFSLSNIVGGGNCYMNPATILVLDGISGQYGSIPKQAAQEFAELIRAELTAAKILVAGIEANPCDDRFSPYPRFWTPYVSKK